MSLCGKSWEGQVRAVWSPGTHTRAARVRVSQQGPYHCICRQVFWLLSFFLSVFF